MRRYNRIACGLFLALLHHAGWAQQDDASRALIEQGNFWLARDDEERAAEAWNKLLLISPEQAQALYGLAQIELRSGRAQGAKTYLQRLKQAQANRVLVEQLEQDILLDSDENKALIAEARQAIALADAELAVKKYRQALGGHTPVGTIGRDYYWQLGYAPDGLSEALEGLRRLSKQSPDDSFLQFALAWHLARNESTRLDGIRGLMRLSGRSDIGSEATESWRAALTWLGRPTPETKPFFLEYLKSHPNDTEIRQQLEQGAVSANETVRRKESSRPDALRQRTDAALKLIEAGDAERARAEFQAVLAKRPNDSEALGGLGVLAMREGNWSHAYSYLTQARKGNSAWQPSLVTAQYWVDVEKAQALHQAGKTTEARRVANQAAKRAPKEVAANILLADILLDEGKEAEAAKAYHAILQRQPDNSQALQGLSKVAMLSGDGEAARGMLESALANNPDDPWLRYQLAQIYQSAGRHEEARGLIEGLLVTHPDDPQALYASALLASDNQEWVKVRDTLGRIPAASLTAPMNQLYAKANLKVQIDEAVGMAKGGRKAEALSWLEQIRTRSGNDLDVVSTVARAYVDIGEPARGLALLRPLRGQGQARSVEASIAYVGLLLVSQQDVEASLVLRQLYAEDLTASQRRLVDELLDTYRIRQADFLTQRGDLVAAYDTLAPVLERRSNDPVAQGALARMYAAGGQGEKAVGLYETLLNADPDNPDLHLGMGQVAQQLRDYRQAEREADIAVSLAPENVEILTAAARIYRASGKPGDAAKLLERAVALETSVAEPSNAQFASSSFTGTSANPFVGLPGQRTTSSLDTASVSAMANGQSSTVPATASTMPVGASTISRSTVQQHVAPAASAVSTLPVPVQAHGAAQMVSKPFSASNPFADPAAVRAPLSDAARDLDEINQERSTRVNVGTELRTRNGDAGTSKLTEAQMPIEVSFPVGNDRMSLRATPTLLSAGSIDAFSGSEQNLLQRSAFEVDDERQRGIGLSVGYQTRGMELDAGVTPLGFQEVGFTGGALFDGQLDDAGTVGYRMDISRRPVTDSVLSFAGRRHSDIGLEWGGVSATGARLTLSKDFGSAGVYGTVAWHSLRGNNVASNHRTELNGGAYFPIIDQLDTKLTMGVNLNAAFFDKNLGHFTYGHGGYFSPKHYYALSLPLTWAQRSGRFSYRLDGSVGVQHFKQDDAPMFPNNADLQAYAERLANFDPSMGDSYYRGESKTGIGYNLKAAAEYRLDSNLVLGAALGADNADDYRQWMGGLYLRYYFYPQRGLLDLPIRPQPSSYGNTYGR